MAEKKQKMVKIRTLVALAGPDFSLPKGGIWEVTEETAEARIALGLAEPFDPPAQRATVSRGGKQAETASVKPDEKRGNDDA